jgi:hypothetical protein
MRAGEARTLQEASLQKEHQEVHSWVDPCLDIPKAERVTMEADREAKTSIKVVHTMEARVVDRRIRKDFHMFIFLNPKIFVNVQQRQRKPFQDPTEMVEIIQQRLVPGMSKSLSRILERNDRK